jgi:hypothetical protein
MWLSFSGWALAMRQWSEYISATVRVFVHKDNVHYRQPVTSYPVQGSATSLFTPPTGCNRLHFKYGRRHVEGGRFVMRQTCFSTSSSSS